jgi:hypothetical protein
VSPPSVDVAAPPEEQWDLVPLEPGPAERADADRGTAADADGYGRLRDGVRSLRVGTAALRLNERTLMVLGSILAVVGLVAIFVGWYGAAHSPFLFQQVPYLISGGLFGLALVFLGAIFYFAHWLTELVKEGRSQSAALVEAIGRLEDTIRQQGTAYADGADVAPERTIDRAGAANGSVPQLVATERGTMAHRPDCVVVAGKRGLRRVGAADGLEPCRLCDPYAEGVSR